ncbi:MAG: alkaline phosphatase family protein [Rhodothermaceae bacterium]|nr:alkaline phosphatase family protein [Rhodothermaceae bacterium]MXZ57268.1 alkaline phosphatase family protein [Rhodothermaceae bacterium]MYB91618.1 alkaline phosphatase family protein [Rhodothermaceae bacterium]MYD68053.1 alkaline phosphatase family protein [Rhodothermaceae bacterium]MYG44637.1 alkaline phosphatase family protein [Rhodothermaceae bacterium]
MILRNSFWLLVLIVVSCADLPDPPNTVILISIDGLRADHITPENTPHLHGLAGKGVHAEYLEPVFPSKTFPNHYSIITGLYPANHGIINNSMYDAELGTFRIGDRNAIKKSEWWGGEPLWITVQKHGHTSATYFWVGSDVDSIQGTQPTYWMEYDHDLPHDVRIDSVMAAVKRTPRPALITTYFSTVDTQGHRSGPKGNETREALKEVDQQIGNLLARLRDAGLYEDLNFVVLGDHGMAETSSERVEFVDDFIDLDDVYMIGGLDALAFFNLKDPTQLDTLLSALNQMQYASWFTRDNIPANWHYSGNERIPDLIGVANEGWQMSSEELFERNPDYYSGGTHGYDPALPSMHSAFVAHGPQFKRGLMVEGFSLIHVYELLCAAIGIEPAPNDGSLEEVKHLLKTIP